MEYIYMILGIVVIIIGAKIFIDGIESTAINFKIPKMFIILTIVAFGTSAPEFAISFQAILKDNGDLVLSNVIGSTVVNTLLIIGIASLIRPIKVQNNTVKKELPLHLFIIAIFCFLYFDSIFSFKSVNSLTRVDAIFLLILFLLFLRYLFYLIKNRQNLIQNEITKEPKYKIKKSVIYTLIGLIMIVIGSNLAVDNSLLVANSLGWSEKITTMIFIVIGTSCPELIMSIVSAKRNQFDFIIGNIIGTNIFNICIVLGLPILLLGTVSSSAFNIIDFIVVIVAGAFLFVAGRNDKIISRREGIIMILIFVCYYGYMFIK